MTRFDVAVLSLRLVALYVWLQTAIMLSYMAFYLADGWGTYPGETSHIVGWLLSIALLVMFGCACFFAAPLLAGRFLPGLEPIETATRSEIGVLGLRICGLLVLANLLAQVDELPFVVKMVSEAEGWSPGHARILVMVLIAGAGVALYLAAPWLSRRLFGAPTKPVEADLLAHVQCVAFSVVGLWLLAGALRRVVEVVIERIETGGFGPDRNLWGEYALAALGLLLFVGGGGVSAFWHWIRSAGLNVSSGQSG